MKYNYMLDSISHQGNDEGGKGQGVVQEGQRLRVVGKSDCIPSTGPKEQAPLPGTQASPILASYMLCCSTLHTM